MRKVVLLIVVVVAAVGALSAGQGAAPEGCVAVNPGATTCTYTSTVPGSILGVRDWIVNIYWDGTCGPEAANWVRASDPAQNTGGDGVSDGSGNNLEGGVAGAWEDSVNQGGYCVAAEALSAGSAVAVGAAQ